MSDFQTLLKTGRAFKRKGAMVVIRYAGDHIPTERTITHLNGSEARATVRALIAEAGRAETDHQYNQMIEKYLSAVREANVQHTHECATPHQCRFSWTAHERTPDCPCGPTLVESSAIQQYIHHPIPSAKTPQSGFIFGGSTE